MGIHENLTREVEKRGIKLTFIANKSGIKYQRLSRVMRGIAPLTLADASKISKVLNIPVEKLLD